MLGAVLYHRKSIAAEPALLDMVLTKAALMAGQSALAFVEAVYSQSGDVSREWKLSSERLAQLKEGLESGRYSSLEFNTVQRTRREQKVHGATVLLHVGQDGTGAFPYEIALLLPDICDETSKQLVQGMKDWFKILDGGYGFVYVGTSWEDVFMEITATPIFPWDKELTAEDKEREERLYIAQDERDQIGTHIRGAYWGNFLSPATIDELGGVTKLQSEAPVFGVELWAGGAYLQLTQSSSHYSTTEYADALAQLANFLGPVTLVPQQ